MNLKIIYLIVIFINQQAVETKWNKFG